MGGRVVQYSSSSSSDCYRLKSTVLVLVRRVFVIVLYDPTSSGLHDPSLQYCRYNFKSTLLVRLVLVPRYPYSNIIH